MTPIPTITFIINEITRPEVGVRKLHKIVIPRLGKSQDIASINAFSNGTRAGVSKTDKLYKYVTCCWSPTALYNVKHEDAWKEDIEWLMAYYTKNGLSINAYIKRTFGIDCNSIYDVPMTTYPTIYDFYKTIGFDHKKRRYIDASGKPIKFSITV